MLNTANYQYASLLQLLLLISGTVELNPGPTKLKYPCGFCNRAVKNSQTSIACDSCNKWFHKGCLPMGDQVFDCYHENETLEWICINYAMNDISYSLFDTSISSDDSDIPVNKLHRKKVKNLRISVCNFQSI